MIVLVPMGGKGTRFTDAGYTQNKACIPTTCFCTGQKKPMVVVAMQNFPEIDNPNTKIICVNRDFHATNGTEKTIHQYFPQTIFIHDHVMLDQAFGCFLAREFLDTDTELFIGTCDSGMRYNIQEFNQAKKHADVLMISHTNNSNIEANPTAHSWAQLKTANGTQIQRLSLKQTVSDTPMNDHATTGMFWFKSAHIFLKYLEQMIWAKDTFDGKYYVDKVLQYCIDDGLRVDYFDVDFICWGTPRDYEIYEQTWAYWHTHMKKQMG